MNKKLKLSLYFIIPFVILAGDLISKYFISRTPRPMMKEVLGNFLRFSFVYNEGVVFGIFNQSSINFMPYILAGLNLIALAVVIALFFKMDKYVKDGTPVKLSRLASMFIAGGALGNNIDRLFFFNDPSIPGHKAVVDFIDVGIKDIRWYTFNIADSFVVIGTILLAIMFLFFEKKDSNDKPVEA